MRTRVLVATAVMAFAAFVDPSLPIGTGNDGAAYAQSRVTGVTSTGGGRLSLDVQGAEIRTVLRSLSEFSGRNIVVGKDVKGQVSIQLKDVPWREALSAVTRTQGLEYIEEGSILRVDTAEKLMSETLARETNESRRDEIAPMSTRVVKVNYAQSEEIRTAIQSVLSKRGAVEVDKRTNALIITDIAHKLDAAEEMAKQLDTTAPQIEIMAKLVDMDLSALKNMGVRWGVSGLDVNHLGNAPDDDPTTLEPSDPDRPVPAQLGVNAGIPDPVGRLTGVLTRPWGNLEAALDVLESKRQATIISNPRITTVDNRQATILVGQKIPLIVQDVAGNAVSQLQTIGIKMTVTPHLTRDKRIQMDLRPEISDLSTQSTVQGGVIINTSEADTRVLVEDGQIAVIGGLIRTNEGEVRTGVPVLMDIPILGHLFRSTSKVKQQRELVIFVRPKLVENFADAQSDPLNIEPKILPQDLLFDSKLAPENRGK
jgi:type IV pilus assembly protein PilQ